MKGVMGLMAHVSTLMGQLLQLIPRHVFDHLVNSYAWQGQKPRTFTYRAHLAAMLFGQWSSRRSLRDMVFSRIGIGKKFIILAYKWQPKIDPPLSYGLV